MKEPFYDAVRDHASGTEADAYAGSAFSVANRLRRGLWNACRVMLYRPSPRVLHGWRSMLLRLFGAKMGEDCRFYPGSRIWAPWNLVCADHVSAGDGVEIYNPAPVRLGSHVILSQGAYLCGATHDYNHPKFPLLAYSMDVGAYAWVCAKAAIAPGVSVGEGAVLGMCSVATRTLEAWTVYAGSPATAVKKRQRAATPAH